MSYLGLLNQRLTIYDKTAYTADGREVLDGGRVVKGRLQEATKRRLMPNGTVLTIDAIAYLPSDVAITTDTKITYSSTTYKVIGIYKAVDGTGNVHNIKAELVKWQ